MRIDNFFPIGILTHHIGDKLADHIENLVVPKLNNLPLNENVLTDFFSQKIITPKEIYPLIQEVYKCQSYYNKETKLETPSQISDFWIQDYKSSHTHGRHNHGRDQYSVVYWVRANDKSGDLVFHTPNPYTYIWGKGGDPINPYSQTSISISPKKGVMVLFPSYLFHEVLKGKEGCIRTTIAFNLK